MRSVALVTVSRCAFACLLVGALTPRPVLAKGLGWTVQPTVEPIASVAQLEARTEQLRRGTWFIYQRDYTGEPDVRGRTLQQDVDQWLMPSASVARLDALHAKALAQDSAHKQPALDKTLAEATILVQQELYREDLVNNYWFYQTEILGQRRYFATLEQRLPPELRTSDPPQITSAIAEAAHELTAALNAANPTLGEQQSHLDQLRSAVERVFVEYGQQRATVTKAVIEAERTNGVAPLMLVRSDPCPPGQGETSGGPKPKFAPDTRAVELDYPPAMRRLNIEGFTVVAATISPSGCATRAAVDVTSGVPELDQAALKWALNAAYLPAERDHQAVEAAMKMGVKFKLSE